mgnify:CR=1 FL=1
MEDVAWSSGGGLGVHAFAFFGRTYSVVSMVRAAEGAVGGLGTSADSLPVTSGQAEQGQVHPGDLSGQRHAVVMQAAHLEVPA